jgi:hypothetical protein
MALTMTKTIARVLLASLILTGPARAQEPPESLKETRDSLTETRDSLKDTRRARRRPVRDGDPSSEMLAMFGVIVAAGGLAIAVRVDPCCCRSNAPNVAGGAAIAGAGVFMVYLGMRPKRVTVAPTIGPQRLGAVAAIQWGSPRPSPRRKEP